jgi:16S rRNA (guanine(966)-N(2))-methyltransferase RsmD
MRIISGKYRGLNLAEFKGDDIRPTADRVKESLFNIINSGSVSLMGATVLDLFCGSGNLGMECLSRGADVVHFNDLSKDSVAVLNKNLKKLKGNERYLVTTSDYLTCLNKLNSSFDLIFIDPPYRFNYGHTALETIAKRGLLKENGIAVYEWDKSLETPVEGLEKFDERKYGKVYLNFYRVKKDEK